MQIMQTDKLELVSHLGGDMANVKALDEQFQEHNPLALDLLKKMLVISPEKRITVE